MALTKTPIELSSTPSIVDGGNATAITIDSSENVGIGGSPTSLLDVSSTGEVISTVRSTSTGGAREATLRLNVASTGGDDPAGRVQFTYGTGYTVAGSIEMSHSTNNMKFLTGTTERMRILSTGGITFNGDTAQANALDDYEEGAWTPTSGVTLSVTTAQYVKIGRLVHVNLDISFTGSTSGSEAAVSLPFPSETTFAGGSISYQNTSVTLVVNIQAAGLKWRTSLTSGDATYAQLSGKRVIMSATYLTTA